MQLQVNLVAQDILAQRAADDRLHGMLGHHVELHAVSIFAAVVAIRTLLNLESKVKMEEIRIYYCLSNTLTAVSRLGDLPFSRIIGPLAVLEWLFGLMLKK